jgi:hypothetical protein
MTHLVVVCLIEHYHYHHIALIIDSSNIQDHDVNRSMNKNANISIYINSELSATGVVSVPSRDETVLSTGTYLYIYIYIRTYVHMYVCIYVCMYVCIAIFRPRVWFWYPPGMKRFFLQVRIYMYIYIRICIYMYVCIYVCVVNYRLRVWFRYPPGMKRFFLQVRIYIYIYIRICIYMYICLCSELSATGVVSVPSRDETVLSTGTYLYKYI